MTLPRTDASVPRIRVVLADDQAMVRAGLRMILEAEPDIDVVEEVADGRAAVEAARWRNPDVILMDVEMPGLDGLAATRQIVTAAPAAGPPRVLILTTFERDDYVFEALRSGASGFLLKNAPPDDLVEAIRIVASGGGLLSPSVTRRIIEAFARAPAPTSHAPEVARLTDREREVLILVAHGLSNAEIADRLVVGEATVKSHVSSVLSKLGLRDRVQAVVFAFEFGARAGRSLIGPYVICRGAQGASAPPCG